LRTSRRTSRASSSARTLHVFRRDLRLADHAGLAEAARYGEVVAALVDEPADDTRRARNPRRSSYRAAAVESLALALRARGTELVYRRGPAAPTVAAIAREAGAQTVTLCVRYDAASRAADLDLQADLEEAGLRVVIVHDAPAVAPEATAALHTDGGERGYRAFAPYAAAWKHAVRVPIADRVTFAAHSVRSDTIPAAPAATLLAPCEPSDPARALEAFERYLAGPILTYPTASTSPAGGATARVSAALSFGVVSARSLLARVDERARDAFLLTEERLALAAFTRALARRDFFLQLAWFEEDEADVALQPHMRDFPYATEHASYESWRCGTTGYPLVDAGIRQLKATGWMHPRARLVAASFCCFDLGIDWRIGRDAWDASLVEDDGALANGNWQWVAGVGADLAQFPRIYNPRKQARAFDPRGTYVRRWIPELAHRSDAELFAVAPPRARSQLALGLYADATYPAPVIDHDTAARAFLARYAKFRTPAPS